MSSEPEASWTGAERALRLWMGFSVWMYAGGTVFFLVLGAYIPAFINLVSSKLFPFLPLYPWPTTHAEGAFWRVLGVSMMAMLTWICAAVYRDPRGRMHLVPILLLSKCCSTVVYLLMFATSAQLAYLVGALTDGPIFIFTYALWFMARAGDRLLDAKEEAILAAAGDALVPRGGAFELGYRDLEAAALADLRRLLAAQNTATLAMSRAALHLLNAAPILLAFRMCTFLTMPSNDRQAFLAKLESHRWTAIRGLCLMVKLYVALPCFSQPAAAEAVGYVTEPRP